MAGPIATRSGALVLLGTMLFLGCGRKDPSAPRATTVTSLVSSASIGTSLGVVKSEAFPHGDVPAPSIVASDTFVAGARVMLAVSFPDSAVALLVGAVGHDGYFRIALTPGALQARDMRALKLDALAADPVRSRQAVSAGQLEHMLVLGAMPGTLVLPLVFGVEFPHSSSEPATHTITASSRATSSDQLQVSLSWAAPVDLDLHVQAPAGADSIDIYYGNRLAAGAALDLDSNAACAIDGVNNENISWGANLPPEGTYRIRVDFWSRCAVTSDTIRYTVTVRQCGALREIPGFALRSQADGGTAFSGKLVESFGFTACASPRITTAAASGSSRH